MIAQTWGEFLTDLWNTEVWSWHSIGAMLVLAVFFALVGILR